ncbi:hypothetical protein BKA70DRAFT_1569753 [Coprinopsis sp. MPI-PUGE-AT-0042]|nr:hypothetical protein BKA70DRAFT_1569753 [Coprinopsis sp. MPI-PUGE-AT-0042]
MVKVQVSLVVLAATLAAAAVPVRQQCGGPDWKGSTDCAEGERCVMVTYAHFECQRESAIAAAAPPPIFLTSLTRIGPKPTYTPRVEGRDEDVPVSSPLPPIFPAPSFPLPPGPKPPVSGPPIPAPSFTLTRSTVRPPWPTRPPIPVPTWTVTRSSVLPSYPTRPPISIPTWPVTRSTVVPTYSTRPPIPIPTWSVTRSTVIPTYTTRPSLPLPNLDCHKVNCASHLYDSTRCRGCRGGGNHLDQPYSPVDPPILTIPVPGAPGPAPPIPSTVLITSLTRTDPNSVPTPRVD